MVLRALGGERRNKAIAPYVLRYPSCVRQCAPPRNSRKRLAANSLLDSRQQPSEEPTMPGRVTFRFACGALAALLGSIAECRERATGEAECYASWHCGFLA